MPLEEFLNLMSGALFVVIPLKIGIVGCGHTTVAQALCLGKPVITNSDAGLEDYVTDGYNGLLVSPGDVSGYRQAITRLLSDRELCASLAQRAQTRATDLTYEAFATRLVGLCQDLLSV
jgi:glycosyltransferase involved in cell wall biosynthesis